MITNFFIPELNNHDVQELWFQQDGAICHTARATIDLLKDTFGDRLISRFGPVNWPPRSCDLTPLDYFLKSCGCCSLLIKIMDSRPAGHVLKPSTTKDPPCKETMHFKSVEAQTSSCLCGVQIKREGDSSGVILIT
ncbi:hypothetical protein TNCV_782531 [Trichonephila clavipes]|nr:hypothetical protein TNCV_782531 [Trichonephila clavipes]